MRLRKGDRMDRDGHDICIESVRPDDIEALLELYVDLFYDREPLTKCMALGKERMVSIARGMYLGSADNPISQGLCWVTLGRRGAGCFIVRHWM